MSPGRVHHERHRADRTGWLRAAVLGANDGIVSTASLVVGVAAANGNQAQIGIAAVAGLVAGATAMAAGEYVSVHSQADTENADLERERKELLHDFEHERRELAAIYIQRGVEPALAREVSVQLMAHDALGAHARDELGITQTLAAKPIQAALASAASFAVGAAVPLAVSLTAPHRQVIGWVGVSSLLFLASLGASAARAGGAALHVGAVRVVVCGALSMTATAAIGIWIGS